MKVDQLKLFDPAEALTEPEDVRAYLRVVLEEGDLADFIAALNVIARSEGMKKIQAISATPPGQAG
jgi:probable addiction module antidote protein